MGLLFYSLIEIEYMFKDKVKDCCCINLYKDNKVLMWELFKNVR